MILLYLTDRNFEFEYTGVQVSRESSKSCVQGSILGPTFWNLILDSLLEKLESAGVYCQAFADDVVLVFSGKEIGPLQETANRSKIS